MLVYDDTCMWMTIDEYSLINVMCIYLFLFFGGTTQLVGILVGYCP